MLSNRQQRQRSLPSSIRRKIVKKVLSNKNVCLYLLFLHSFLISLALSLSSHPGKSSLVPQALVDDIGGPVLYTQPRRLAVVAVASYVASQRDVLLGGDEVGYHVGQDRNANRNTDLVFATAGVLLEELKSRGLDALTRYKVVVIDECHERSCESDLALTMIREFMAAHPRSNLWLVLLSAAFDHAKYGACSFAACRDASTWTPSSSRRQEASTPSTRGWGRSTSRESRGCSLGLLTRSRRITSSTSST